MRIVRTFHPVGQGAFYSERFYDETKECVFNVVYDCGVESVDLRRKRLVRQAFDKDDVIDYLFVSHLDEDHISLVTTLRDSVKFIRRVVLPYVGIKDVVIHKILSQALGMTEVNDFWVWIYEVLEGENHWETSFLFVEPEGEDQQGQESGNVRSLNSGEVIPASVFPVWVFRPFNTKRERIIELDALFEEVVSDPVFQNALSVENIQIRSAQELIDKIRSDSFADLIGNKVIKKYLQKTYQNLTGGINKNSLLVYSGPEKSEIQQGGRIFALNRYWWYQGVVCWKDIYGRCACMYTGDSDLDMDDYRIKLGPCWDYVGMIQLPHHGSYSSFKLKKNSNSFGTRSYFFPVSCGENNKYGHPSGKVISFLLANRCLPFVITENSSTCFIEVIDVQ